MSNQVTNWVQLDGCCTLAEVVQRLNTIRNDYIGLYRAGAVVSVPFQSGEGQIQIKPIRSRELLQTVAQMTFRSVRTDLLLPRQFAMSIAAGECTSDQNCLTDDEDEPTFQVIRSHRILYGCSSMEQVIDALEQAIYRYKKMHYEGWELGDEITKNHGFLFLSKLFFMSTIIHEE